MSAREGLSDRPVITIFGATGAQGGGLAARDPRRSRSAASALRAVDAQAAARPPRARWPRPAPKSSSPTSTTPQRASARCDGAHGAFCVTNFWEHFSPERELAQAHDDGARPPRAPGVAHVVWSTLEDTRDVRRRRRRRCRC